MWMLSLSLSHCIILTFSLKESTAAFWTASITHSPWALESLNNFRVTCVRALGYQGYWDSWSSNQDVEEAEWLPGAYTTWTCWKKGTVPCQLGWSTIAWDCVMLLIMARNFKFGGVVEGKGGGIYGDRRCVDFGWWAHRVMYRPCVMEMCTWNLYAPIDQCHPTKLNNILKRKLMNCLSWTFLI